MTAVPVAVGNIGFQIFGQLLQRGTAGALWGRFFVFVGENVVHFVIMGGKIFSGERDLAGLRFFAGIPKSHFFPLGRAFAAAKDKIGLVFQSVNIAPHQMHHGVRDPVHLAAVPVLHGEAVDIGEIFVIAVQKRNVFRRGKKQLIEAAVFLRVGKFQPHIPQKDQKIILLRNFQILQEALDVLASV